MSSEIKQGQAIEQAVKFIEETKSKLQNVNSRTVSEATAQGQSGWKGAGGTAFRNLMNTYEEKSREITNALDQLTAGLTKARQLGSEADQDVAGQSSAIAGDVQGTKYSF
ncbi:MAG: WXG100 family type VII secretion target [Nocardioides sp.]|uniref:WXG100 family type VII secretion target n=1 Tax=Nocardioides sp. TaxID=35761 RepID=UPI003D6A55FE